MTKVQKFLYIAYGAMLGVYGIRLVDEHPQAWPLGPVFPTTRNNLLRISDWNTITISDTEVEEVNRDQQMHKLVELVLRSFGNLTATQLSEWSHKTGSPWDYCTKMEGFKWGDRMDDNLIKMYFKSIIIVSKDAKGTAKSK